MQYGEQQGLDGSKADQDDEEDHQGIFGDKDSFHSIQHPRDAQRGRILRTVTDLDTKAGRRALFKTVS